jgi:uncharacterized protein
MLKSGALATIFFKFIPFRTIKYSSELPRKFLACTLDNEGYYYTAMSIDQKYNNLRGILNKLGKVLVAYSGGVDSTFLLKVALDTLGQENVTACIAKDPCLAESQYNQAQKIARWLGIELKTVEPTRLNVPEFTQNPPDRCYICKKNVFETLRETARQDNIPYIICGENSDDADTYRPGQKAIKECDIPCPLAETGLTKKEIRTLSSELNLPTANSPSTTCLVTRIAYGEPVTEEKLGQIEKAEDYLREIGFENVRVRCHQNIARIEIPPAQLTQLCDNQLRTEITDKFKSLGFAYITADLQGLRSGSMDETLGEN